jgi:hypothetical protein
MMAAFEIDRLVYRCLGKKVAKFYQLYLDFENPELNDLNRNTCSSGMEKG